MKRLYEYCESRLPPKGSKVKTINCKFSVETLRMLIEFEKRNTNIKGVENGSLDDQKMGA